MSGNKISVLLGVVCLCLIGGLIFRHVQAVEKERIGRENLETVQQQLVTTQQKLQVTQQTNVLLQKELETTANELVEMRQRLITFSNDNVRIQGDLAKTTQEKQSALTEANDKDKQIEELESRREELRGQLTTLGSRIQNLERLIDLAKNGLSQSEGERNYLLRELKRLQDEKESIRLKFNNLAMLRDRMNELRNQLTVTRRVEWVKRGLGGGIGTRRGAELLALGFQKPIVRTNYNLNVEIKQSGDVRILRPPPITDQE